jgi:FkbM family methyltransferase
MDAALTDRHAEAVEIFSRGATGEALDLLRATVREALDLDAVNDLAVMLSTAGHGDAARELLLAMRHIDPDHEGAAENLASLDDTSMDEARERFLQVIAEAKETRLTDNLDHFFHPGGHPLPDAAGAGARIAEQLAVLERCGTFWRGAGDENTRALLLRWLAYRALGPEHVRVELQPVEYRNLIVALAMKMQVGANVLGLRGMPLEWQFHAYDLSSSGCDARVIGQPLPIASTYLFSQYAYRNASVGARPLPGDVALDAGGCWGETAIWLAHAVGPAGHVHSFEPTPANRELLAKNVELNPHLAPRVTVWDAPLAATAGDTVFIRNSMAAGATVRAENDGDDAAMCELTTDTIDAMVARGDLPRVDFLKVDVEGADLSVLRGAAESIRTFRPRLAIAAYHRPDDLATIPDYLESLGVRYTWYLQASTMTDVDTVAFAVPVE